MSKETKVYSIRKSDSAAFNNYATFCVGTGRIGLALRHEYHEQLKRVQEDIGFKYIRGHGLFSDDMAVYHTYEEDGVMKEEYNFSYIDLVFDDYLSLGIKPFVEFGFMPGKMASGDQTIFYWKGNVTPPDDYDKWARLVKATIMHWIERYGIAEVRTWLYEVWNEPNLPGFWKGADMQEYFKLYDVTARAVKSCDEALRVGGPAICGVDDERWLQMFLEHCRDNKIPLDFVTRHAYGTELPEWDGHYVYQELREPTVFPEEMNKSRSIIDSFPEYKGMEMHITEYNTSYSPRNPVHDTNLNAAYIARLLSDFGDTCASYSYWTFGDVFEEMGVAFTPFSGCFGLMTNGGIPKPTYWSYVFYKDLYPAAAVKDEHLIVTKSSDGASYRGVVWNPVLKGSSALAVRISLELDDGEYLLVTKTVDEQHCNPLRSWVDMGSPPYPSSEQLCLLRECAKPLTLTKRITVTGGSADIDFDLSSNAVCYFDLSPVTAHTDRGFHVDKVL